MSHFVRDAFTITSTDGTTTVTTFSRQFNGQIWAAGYYADPTSYFPSSATLTLSLEDTSQTFIESVAVSTSLHWYYPRAQVHGTTGGGLTNGTTGTAAITDLFTVSGERIRATVDMTSNITTGQGGNIVIVVQGSMP